MKIGKLSTLLLATLICVGSLLACPTFSKPPLGILTGNYSFWPKGTGLVILGNGKVQTAQEIKVQRPNEAPRIYKAGDVFAVWNGVPVLTTGYVRLRVVE